MENSKQISILVNNLSFRYDNTPFVLKKLSTEFQSDSIYEIVGENGSGKSTLLKLIASILKPTYGSIELTINSKKIVNYKDSIIYITHNHQLYQNLTIKENLKLFSKIYGIKDFNKNSSFQEFFSEKFGDKKIVELSRGMQQFLNLMIGVETDRDIFLYDEPFSGLDKKRVREIEKIILEQSLKGKLIIYVSHTESNFKNIKKIII
ncbi:ATP-binding cassette domain-containing protein [bacterium]|nr:ATP-binding cassette domain-containing protein [bacterium]